MYRNEARAAAQALISTKVIKSCFFFSNSIKLLHLNNTQSFLLLKNNNFSTSAAAQRLDFYNEIHASSSNHSQLQHIPLGSISYQTPSNNNGFYRKPQNPNVSFQQNTTTVGDNRFGQDTNLIVNRLSTGGNGGGGGISPNFQPIQKNSTVGQDRSINDGGDSQQNNAIGYSSNPQFANTGNQENSLGVQGNQNGTYASNFIGDLRSTSTKADTKSTESSPYAGTIEELDGFCKELKLKAAVEVLEMLEKKGVIVDLPRYIQLMQACGNVGFLDFAKSVHDHLMRSAGGHIEVSVHNMILEMYSKCGSMSDAYEAFENMRERNLTSWDTMITGFAKNGLGKDAMVVFTWFKEAGLRPDGQMFLGVLLACSVLCDIREGMLQFESMSRVYGIVPSVEHYVVVVNMLGSTGYLDEAEEFIEKLPIEPNVDVWETLMNICRAHGNTEIGDHCAEIVNFLDPSRLTDKAEEKHVATALAKKKEEVKLSDNLLAVKASRIQEEFMAGDISNPQNAGLYAVLRGLREQMKEAGYVPEIRIALHDVDEESREEAIFAHSEKLAVSKALITSTYRAPVRIMKNLRICGDCHNAMKIISDIVGRELIIRDNKRFHHFKGGFCSCNDFW